MVAHVFKVCDHSGRIGAKIRLSKAKASQPFSRGKFRQIFFLLGIRAKAVNWEHDQGTLYGGCRAHARIPSFNFLHHEAIGNIIKSPTPIFHWYSWAK